MRTSKELLCICVSRMVVIAMASVICMACFNSLASGQNKQKSAKKKEPQPFSWVNPLKKIDVEGLQHATFRSESMGIDVGYCIYLPPAYSLAKNSDERYPVVYYLHGGRPGSEVKSTALLQQMHANIESGKVPPMIYVFVNGGPVSHYNMPEMENGMGEDVFIKELIPHVDKTYRTIADRSGRGLEGFSQGGRGTARIMFKHPELFCSAAPGGGGYETEKMISENNGYENEHLKFADGYNTWDLARGYAEKLKSDPQTPKLKILFHVGTKGFNYENNLQYMKFLETLGIPFEKVIVQDATHSAQQIYQAKGLEIMKFHADNFAK